MILFGTIGYFLPTFIYYLANSSYNREAIDGILSDYFSHANMSDTLADEALIVAYSYNSYQPRFYSKYEAKNDKLVYNIQMDIIAGATSAAPGYFDPKIFKNGKGETEVLVDGGIIANNPSMYAFIYASELNKKENIRLISIGTGYNPPDPIDPNNIDILTWVDNLSTLLVDVEVTAHAYYTEFLSQKYERFQIKTDLPLNAVDGQAMEDLKNLGKQLIEDNKERLDRVIREIVDEKFAK